MVTPNSQASKHCRDELQFAFANRIPVVSVHLQPTELSAGLRLSLGAVQAIFRYELDTDAYREKLVTALSSYVSSYDGRDSGVTIQIEEAELRHDAPTSSSRSGREDIDAPPAKIEPQTSEVSVGSYWKRAQELVMDARATVLKVAGILTIAMILFLYFVQPRL